MEHGSTSPEDAAAIRARWARTPQEMFKEFTANLTGSGIDTRDLRWLSLDESAALVGRWKAAGAQRYGKLALLAPEGRVVRRGEFADGDLPPWLDRKDRQRRVFVSFSCSAGGEGPLAECEWGYILDNLSALLRADGDGFAVVTSGLEGVLLVNMVDDRPLIGLDAWGEFLQDKSMD